MRARVRRRSVVESEGDSHKERHSGRLGKWATRLGDRHLKLFKHSAKQAHARPSRRESTLVGDMMRKLKAAAKPKANKSLGHEHGAGQRRRRNHFEFAVILRDSPLDKTAPITTMDSDARTRSFLSLTSSFKLGLGNSHSQKYRVHAADQDQDSKKPRERQRFTLQQAVVIKALQHQGLEVQAVPFTVGPVYDMDAISAQRQLLLLITAAPSVLQSEKNLLNLGAWLRSGTGKDLAHSALEAEAGTTTNKDKQQEHEFSPAERIMLLNSIISRCEVRLPTRDAKTEVEFNPVESPPTAARKDAEEGGSDDKNDRFKGPARRLLQTGMVVTLYPLHDKVASHALLKKRALLTSLINYNCCGGGSKISRGYGVWSPSHSHINRNWFQKSLRWLCTRHISVRNTALVFWHNLNEQLWLSDGDLDEIRNHFGDEYGFYYAWSTHYTQWLAPLALASVLLLITETVGLAVGDERAWGSNPWGERRTQLRNIYGLCLSLWAVAMLSRWRQRTFELCVRWDLSDLRGVEHLNPDFQPWAEHEAMKMLKRLQKHGRKHTSKLWEYWRYLTCYEYIHGGDGVRRQGSFLRKPSKRSVAAASSKHSKRSKMDLRMSSGNHKKTLGDGMYEEDEEDLLDTLAEDQKEEEDSKAIELERELERVHQEHLQQLAEGEEEDYYPWYRRAIVTILGASVMSLLIMALFFIVFCIFAFEMYLIFKWGRCEKINSATLQTLNLTTSSNNTCDPFNYWFLDKIPQDRLCTSATMNHGFTGWITELVPGLAEALAFELLLQVFTRTTEILVVWQNWRTLEQRETAYAWQIFTMEFFGMFMFYLILAIGFVPDWFPDHQWTQGEGDCHPCKQFPDTQFMDWFGRVTGLYMVGMKWEWSLSCIKSKAPPGLRLRMMQDYMVTPFVVNQLLGVLFKTILPAIVHNNITRTQRKELAEKLGHDVSDDDDEEEEEKQADGDPAFGEYDLHTRRVAARRKLRSRQKKKEGGCTCSCSCALQGLCKVLGCLLGHGGANKLAHVSKTEQHQHHLASENFRRQFTDRQIQEAKERNTKAKTTLGSAFQYASKLGDKAGHMAMDSVNAASHIAIDGVASASKLGDKAAKKMVSATSNAAANLVDAAVMGSNAVVGAGTAVVGTAERSVYSATNVIGTLSGATSIMNVARRLSAGTGGSPGSIGRRLSAGLSPPQRWRHTSNAPAPEVIMAREETSTAAPPEQQPEGKTKKTDAATDSAVDHSAKWLSPPRDSNPTNATITVMPVIRETRKVPPSPSRAPRMGSMRSMGSPHDKSAMNEKRAMARAKGAPPTSSLVHRIQASKPLTFRERHIESMKLRQKYLGHKYVKESSASQPLPALTPYADATLDADVTILQLLSADGATSSSSSVAPAKSPVAPAKSPTTDDATRSSSARVVGERAGSDPVTDHSSDTAGASTSAMSASAKFRSAGQQLFKGDNDGSEGEGPREGKVSTVVMQLIDMRYQKQISDLFNMQVKGALDELSKWEPEIFNEHLELVLQFCWVCFFAMIFPYGPLFALFNNLIEVRADAYKLCNVSRRPIPKSVDGIGAWFDIMLNVAYSSVLVNLLLMVLALQSLPAWSTAGGATFTEYWMPALLVVLGGDRIIIACLRSIEMAVPSASPPVRREMKLRERAVKKTYMEIHNVTLAQTRKEAGTRKFNAGDIARVVKIGSQTGRTCVVIDPAWGERVKVIMQKVGDDTSTRAEKSYLATELERVY